MRRLVSLCVRDNWSYSHSSRVEVKASADVDCGALPSTLNARVLMACCASNSTRPSPALFPFYRTRPSSRLSLCQSVSSTCAGRRRRGWAAATCDATVCAPTLPAYVACGVCSPCLLAPSSCVLERRRVILVRLLMLCAVLRIRGLQHVCSCWQRTRVAASRTVTGAQSGHVVVRLSDRL